MDLSLVLEEVLKKLKEIKRTELLFLQTLLSRQMTMMIYKLDQR